MSVYSFPRITGDALRDGDFLDPDDLLPGEWMPVRGEILSAIIRCPVCKRTSSLIRANGEEGHAIADDGTVTPSIVCPIPGCTFHVNGKLLNWKSDSIVVR